MLTYRLLYNLSSLIFAAFAYDFISHLSFLLLLLLPRRCRTVFGGVDASLTVDEWRTLNTMYLLHFCNFCTQR